MQDQVPVLTPVGGPVDPPLGILAKRMTKCGNICNIRIFGMNTDLPYMAGPLNTEGNPTFSPLSRLSDTHAKKTTRPNRGLPRARVNSILIPA